ncbi:M1 family metallopeptidase [Allosphingosinicella vermicomposti]|uniref:M1 family metallopeptidase n=1 Tax=Allosphingosinicella vermicomposti TaxID=614671 RepID=UPI000D0EFD8F|nr:M1 family metallopeptidase [Allosphingosinicella vermicomposti]
MTPRLSVLLLSGAAIFSLAACSPATQGGGQVETAGQVAPILDAADAKDVHSYARPEIARVTHMALDLTADFAAKRIGGTATLDVQAAPGAKEIILDSKGLEILKVTDGNGRALEYALGTADPTLGAPLTIQLNGANKVAISYGSAPDAAALQWLAPEQTAGKKLPFLFSQGQAILNRTWIPTQDSPGIRQTWEARITVPDNMVAVMSGDRLTPNGEKVEGGKAYRFKMDKPVAPYLVAIAVGDLAFQQLGPRTGVFAEPATLKASAYELADTEKMVEAAEALYGPYRWGRYDMIVLPPAFPFGGMENPTLTFLTPTMIAGDRSLVSLIAHELAHSWSGNLVTNAAWADFWLNEGFTVYFEGRIMEALYGKERADQLISLGWDSMQATITDLGGAQAPGTRLHLDLKGSDPDDGMNDIAYEKGAAFLRTIEQTVGRARFDAWLRGYFDRYAFQPTSASRFLEDIRANLVKGDSALEQKLMLDQWVYQPGLPSNVAPPPTAAFAAVDQAVKAFSAGGPVSAVPYQDWETAERLRFLNGIPRSQSKERLAELDRAFSLNASGNSEILFAWLQLAIANRYDPAAPALDKFLSSMGRRKFVAPLFQSLVAQGDWGKAIATRIYGKTRSTYHSVTYNTVDATLKGS